MKKRKIAALLVSFALLLGLVPMGALASETQTGAEPAVTVEITGFAPVAGQTLTVGDAATPTFPEKVTATVSTTTVTSVPGENGEVSEQTEVVNTEEELPVSWSLPEGEPFSTAAAKTFTYTAALTEETRSVSAALPTFTVQVVAAPQDASQGATPQTAQAAPAGAPPAPTMTISEFTEPDVIEIAVGDGHTEQELIGTFPDSVFATVNDTVGESVEVTEWTRVDPPADTAFSTAQAGEYYYVPTLAEGYTLAGTATMPNQLVKVGEVTHEPQLMAEVGAFTVTGSTSDYEFTGTSGTNGVLTITDSGALTIANTNPTTPTKDGIIVATGVTANITLNGVNIDVSGSPNPCAFEIAGNATANITLEENTTNTLKSRDNNAGLQVQISGGNTATLNLKGTGTLNATGGYGGAGIGGGGNNGAGGAITISGGMVTAQGGDHGAGIGGGIGGAGGNITIEGGTVTATGDGTSAGIGGGGNNGAGGNIHISGGTVSATGGVFGSGSTHGGAGIGGGSGGAGGNITISGTAVITVAQGGGSSAGIGGGDEGASGIIKIEGGTVTAKGGTSAYTSGAGIGGGSGSNGGEITISGGNVTATAGDVTVGVFETEGGGAGIGGGDGGAGGTIKIEGGTVSATGGGSSDANGGGAGIGGGYKGAGGDITISGGDVTAKGDEHGAGIGGGSNGAGGNITINGSAVITLAQGDSTGAGIGGGRSGSGGNITISGSAVITSAEGGSSGAGIGGGRYRDGGQVNILGGAITAEGGNGAAGIGGGRGSDGGSVNISGGMITATGGGGYPPSDPGIGGTGIGDGQDGANCTVTISGGTVTATGGNVAQAFSAKPIIPLQENQMAKVEIMAGTSSPGTAVFPSMDYHTNQYANITLFSVQTPSIVYGTDPGVYTGAPQTLSVTSVTLGGTLLTEGTDYTVSGNTATNAGDYTLTITGAGNYIGAVTKSYTIQRATLTITGATAQSRAYDGTTNATADVSFGGLLNGETLNKDTDYTVGATFPSPDVGDNLTVGGVVQLTRTAAANNYIFSNAEFSFPTAASITPLSLAGAQVALGTPIVANGTLQTQSIASITLGNLILTEGTDYTVSGNTATNAGGYTLTITGTGNYMGTLAVPFTAVSTAGEALPYEPTGTMDLEHSTRPSGNALHVTERSEAQKQQDLAKLREFAQQNGITGIVHFLADITMTDANGNEVQPENGNTRVRISVPGVTPADTVTVLHIKDDGSVEKILPITVGNGYVEFYPTSFSVYSVVVNKAGTGITSALSPQTGAV